MKNTKLTAAVVVKKPFSEFCTLIQRPCTAVRKKKQFVKVTNGKPQNDLSD